MSSGAQAAPAADDEHTAGFSLVCLGVSGGPLEHNCSCYVFKPAQQRWDQGTVLLEGGSWLGSLSRLLEHPASSPFQDATFPEESTAESRVVLFNSWVKSMLVSHGHLDHFYGMVLASAAQPSQRPLYGTRDTLETIQGVFNGHVWPRLASFRAEDPLAFYHLRPLEVRQVRTIAPGITVTPYPLYHGLTWLPDKGGRTLDESVACPNVEQLSSGSVQDVPSTAFLLTNEACDRSMLFLGDVEADAPERHECNQALWRAVAPRVAGGQLRTVFIECSFSNAQPKHMLFGHLNPSLLYAEVRTLARCVRAERGQSDDAASMAGTLRGLRFVVVHVKGLVLSKKLQHDRLGYKENEDRCVIGDEHDTRPLSTVIHEELQELEAEHRLGVEFVMAQQGLRLEC